MIFSGERMTRAQALHLNPAHWAYVGDAVFDLYVITHIVTTTDYPVGQMHRQAVRIVNCKTQAEALDRLEPLLTDEELGIVRRRRNAKGHDAPRNSSPEQYARATSLEALVGFLYLTGQNDRMLTLIQMGVEKNEQQER